MKSEFLCCQSISLSLNGVPILEDINLSLREGEFHVLLGENGAGKTSIIQILGGVYPHGQYGGRLLLDGRPLCLCGPLEALEHGIVTVHQDPCLFEKLTVAENLFVNAPENFCAKKLMSPGEKVRRAREFFSSHGLSIDVSQRVGELSLPKRRMIELVRLYRLSRPRLLILDEPTACLNGSFDIEFHALLNHFRDLGTTILFIAHEYRSMLPFIDRISVLRDGRLVRTMDTEEFLQSDVNQLLWGRYWKKRYPKLEFKKGKEVLCVEHLGCDQTAARGTRHRPDENVLRDISFSLRKGEILGIFGAVGSGKSMLARAIFGLEPSLRGTIYIDRLKASVTSPQAAISLGLAYVTDERKEYGLFQEQDALENAFSLGRDSFRGVLRRTGFEYRQFGKYARRLNLEISPLGRV